jgi:UDP-GlcNAc:undecaprenyl-phosphate GlcNAc-1-phosphate transferase
MQYSQLVLACLVAACASALAIALMSRIAAPIGLVDRPNERKCHTGHVPLVGGLSAFFGVLVGVCVYSLYAEFARFTQVMLGTAGVMVLLGALDDRFELSVRTRLLVQTAAVLFMVATTGVYIHTLGHVFGHEFELGVLGIPLTVIAVIGLLNAFNMMDGIDGLAGSMALVSIGAIILFNGPYYSQSTVMLLLLMAALAPYLASNLGLVGRKIFLGDAGSMVIGYLLAWTLIRLSQESPAHSQLSTIDVLWCVALPVLDTLAVMVRRVREGKSPFQPDRGHIHHILLGAGMGPRTALFLLITAAIMLALIGSVTGALAPGSNLLAFVMVALTYVTVVNRVWQRQQARTHRPASATLPKTLPAPPAIDAPAVLAASATVVQLRPGIAANFDIKPVGAAGTSPQRVVAIEPGRSGHVASMHGNLPAEPIVRVTTAGEKR